MAVDKHENNVARVPDDKLKLMWFGFHALAGIEDYRTRHPKHEGPTPEQERAAYEQALARGLAASDGRRRRALALLSTGRTDYGNIARETGLTRAVVVALSEGQP